MYRKPNNYLVLLAVMVLMSMTVGPAIAAPVTQSITYQGKLTNAAGTPLTGTYSVTFKLYDASTGGTTLCTDTHSVTAANGLFTSPITITDPAVVDGRALWLGIQVGTDPEMTPLQEIRPVPYALSLRPGARITSSDPSSALNLGNEAGGGGNALGAYTTGTGSHGVVASTGGPHSDGVQAYTSGQWSHGVSAYTTNASSPGIYTYTRGTLSHGVYAYTTGLKSVGIGAYTSGSGSPALDGESREDVGVHGKGKEGGFFTTNQGGTSSNDLRAGVNSSTTFAFNPGMTIKTTGYSSNGLRALTTGDGSNGVEARTSGSGSKGVYACTTSDNSEGIYASTEGLFSTGVLASTHGNYSTGVNVFTQGFSSHGVSIMTDGIHSEGLYVDSAKANAIWAETGNADNKYGLQTPDYIRALGYETGSSDVAEYMPVTGDVEPGTVLIIGEDGKLQLSTIAYDTSVAGIVSTAPGVSLGAKEGGNPGEQLIAVAGRVPCKVDASNGPIHPKDLLTTSDNPGYAMKAEPIEVGGRTFYPSGIVLGKAMGTLESGTGTVEVLVTLQ